MTQTLDPQAYAKARESFMVHVRKVVPYALFTAVGTGLYMITQVFGEVGEAGLSSFQMMLLLKTFLGLWLGLRGFNQKLFKIDPWLFKSHRFPLMLVIIIILLSQFMYI